MAANNEVVREGGQPGRQLPEVEALLPRKDSEGWGDARTRCRRTHSSRRRFRLPLAIARLRDCACLRCAYAYAYAYYGCRLTWAGGRRVADGDVVVAGAQRNSLPVGTSPLLLARLAFGFAAFPSALSVI